MAYRMLPIFFVGMALAFFTGAPVVAADDEQLGATHEGKFVKLQEDKLIMTDKEDQEHSHILAANAKVTIDGKDAEVKDLKEGMRLKVTTKKDDPKTVVRVEAKTPN